MIARGVCVPLLLLGAMLGGVAILAMANERPGPAFAIACMLAVIVAASRDDA